MAPPSHPADVRTSANLTQSKVDRIMAMLRAQRLGKPAEWNQNADVDSEAQAPPADS